MARFGLSRKTEYAVVALAQLARQQAAADEGWLSARELAEMESLPLTVLSGLMKQLQRAGVVASRRGVQGGYHLVNGPETLRLAEVIRAVEDGEPVQLARCCGPEAKAHKHSAAAAANAEADTADAEGCRLACTCPIRHAIQRLDRQLSGLLEAITLADLLAGEVDQPEEATL